jgi:hypothetical protein
MAATTEAGRLQGAKADHVIQAIYRVEVAIPRRVIEDFGRDGDFTFELIRSTSGHTAAGRGREPLDGSPYEWAEFLSRDHALRCEQQLHEIVAKFIRRLSATLD